MVKDADNLKSVLQTAQASFMEIVRAVESDDNWSWAKSGKMEQIEKVDSKIRKKLTDWQKTYLINRWSLADMKKTFARQRYQKGLTEFVKMQPMTEKFTQACSSALEAHAKSLET